jgi:hypothetical protein
VGAGIKGEPTRSGKSALTIREPLNNLGIFQDLVPKGCYDINGMVLCRFSAQADFYLIFIDMPNK